jgi:cullin 2
MSLKPKRVDFVAVWDVLRETLSGVITFSSVPRSTWNDRFSGKQSLPEFPA